MFQFVCVDNRKEEREKNRIKTFVFLGKRQVKSCIDPPKAPLRKLSASKNCCSIDKVSSPAARHDSDELEGHKEDKSFVQRRGRNPIGRMDGQTSYKPLVVSLVSALLVSGVAKCPSWLPSLSAVLVFVAEQGLTCTLIAQR